jgi:hypothetical protein
MGYNGKKKSSITRSILKIVPYYYRFDVNIVATLFNKITQSLKYST